MTMDRSTTADDGRLEEADGRWRVVFRRELSHPAEKVWRAVTEPEHLDEWFPTTIDGDRAAGADLVFRFRDGEAEPFGGRMQAFEPGRLMDLDWGPDRIRIETEPKGPDECLLTLTDTFEEKGKAARDGAGWHVCLDALGAWLDGRSRGRAAELDRWREIEPGYLRRFGPEFSTVGPPEGHPAGDDPSRRT
jgi:uncharacterized protein YndB with AHSA1/START domain